MQADDETTDGFSFQLSQSAPPAEAAEASGPNWFSPPQGELSLDLAAFEPTPVPVPSAQSEASESPHHALAISGPPPAVPVVRKIAFPVRAAAESTEAVVSSTEAASSVSPDSARRTPGRLDPSGRSGHDGPPAGAWTLEMTPSAPPPGPTLFSQSVSSAPRVRLDSNEESEAPPAASRPSASALQATDLDWHRDVASPDDEDRWGIGPSEEAPLVAPRTGPQRLSAADVRERMSQVVGRAWSRSLREVEHWKLAERARDLGARGLSQVQTWRQRVKQRRLEASESIAPSTADVPPTDTSRPNGPDLGFVEAVESAKTRDWVRTAAQAGGALVAAAVCYAGVQYGVDQISGSEGRFVDLGESTAPAVSSSEAPPEAEKVAASATTPASDDATLLGPGPDPEGEKTAKSAAARTAAPPTLEELELPEGMQWPGKGLIEVVTEERELIYVDGVFTGRGPLRRIPVGPGKHELEVRKEGQSRTHRVQVVDQRRTRIVFSS